VNAWTIFVDYHTVLAGHCFYDQCVYVASFSQFSPCDVFVGYHEDAPASICLVYQDNALEKAKTIFLRCATPDAISRFSTCKFLNFTNFDLIKLVVQKKHSY
jgi:hypothetical protein